MQDLVKCMGDGCPFKSHCLRYTKRHSKIYYFFGDFYEDMTKTHCPHFVWDTGLGCMTRKRKSPPPKRKTAS